VLLACIHVFVCLCVYHIHTYTHVHTNNCVGGACLLLHHERLNLNLKKTKAQKSEPRAHAPLNLNPTQKIVSKVSALVQLLFKRQLYNYLI
jgi:hypothetical protein